MNASSPKGLGTARNYLVRIARGTLRLCQAGDPVHPSRTGGTLYPDQSEVPAPYWPLWRKWSDWQEGAAGAVAMPVTTAAGVAVLAGTQAGSDRTGAPSAVGGPWYREGRIQEQVAVYLIRQGYAIQRTADPESREGVKYILARRADGHLLWVRVIGYPEVRGFVHSQHWLKDAVFDLLVYRGESLHVDVALGLPDGYESYQGLLTRIGWLRRYVPFRCYWVSELGAVPKGKAVLRPR